MDIPREVAVTRWQELELMMRRTCTAYAEPVGGGREVRQGDEKLV